jgi:hypothetical protein
VPKIVPILATFSVGGGNAQDVEIDTEGLTPDQIAEALINNAETPSLCHQCARDISDPELSELTSFTLDGVEYVEHFDGSSKTEWKPATR